MKYLWDTKIFNVNQIKSKNISWYKRKNIYYYKKSYMNNLIDSGIKNIYNNINFHKSKDKNSMVLEPLQAMIQISLLSVCPIGTKLTIQDNILYLQHPNLIQPFQRWYNSDKKDDVFYLFQVIRRFMKWQEKYENDKLYDLIIEMGKKGLDNLMTTYSNSDSNTVIQVIHMYKSLLENKKVEEKDQENNIDEIFEKINKIYNKQICDIIYNILILIKDEEDLITINNYIDGLNMIMFKTNKEIKNWIKIHLFI